MPSPTRWWRSTIRVRLTLLFAGAFFIAGAALVVLIHLYLGQVVNHQLTVRGDITHLSPDVPVALGARFQRVRDGTLNTMPVAPVILV